MTSPALPTKSRTAERIGAPSPPLAVPQTYGVALLVFLALAGVALFLRAQQSATGNLWGVPLDDAYIHFRFAQNLATGHGFAFNPDAAVPGSTSPLWVIILAASGVIGVPLWLAAKVYGVLFLIAAAILTWKLTLRMLGNPVAALGAGALTALDGRLLWAAPSGMEVTLFAALCLAAFLARPSAPADGVDRRVLLVAALCGLATLTRPEGVLLTAVLAIDLFGRRKISNRSLIAALVLYVAVAAPYDIFSQLSWGHPLPTTFYAKAGGQGLGPAVQYVIVLMIYVFETNAALFLFAPVGAVMLWRSGGEARTVVAWPVLLIVEQGFVSPLSYHFGRYSMPLEPFFAIWAVVGIGRLARSPGPAVSLRAVLPYGALVVVGMLSIGGWANAYALSVQNINDMQVALGRWVRSHVPLSAPVATHDIGAIGYYSGHRVVDIVGLVTPHFIDIEREQPQSRRSRDLYSAVVHLGARYLIIMPAAFPELAVSPGLRPVHSVSVRRQVIEPARTMVVYQLPR